MYCYTNSHVGEVEICKCIPFAKFSQQTQWRDNKQKLQVELKRIYEFVLYFERQNNIDFIQDLVIECIGNSQKNY